ncbi:c-type cytochrome [Sulfurimonas sp. SAG-AH-194-C21]|nr:c-type cytochrome [Sulfurimonas sp. SAG-AH-194-C21]MDF1883428.1 c-type cytochrome [Sulfurimonas sp. SAG-AH-194-C21]
MFKLEAYNKLLISTSVAAVVAFSVVGCMGDSTEPSGSTTSVSLDIDGGVSYPVVNNKTSDYYVNPQAIGAKINNGRVPNAAELAKWDTDLQPATPLSPEGHGIPEGSGSVEDGETLYEAQCVMCHGDFGSGGGGYPALSKGNAVDLQKTLTNNRWKDPEADGPTRVFGSYWPQATTMWWYIRDGMPHPFSDSLSIDETYALTAYILNINEMYVDGEEVDDEYVLNRAKFLKIKMPNVDGFEPVISGANVLGGVKAYFGKASNFGGRNLNQGAEHCMKDCQEPTAKIKRIQNGGIKDFIPAMNVTRDLPKKEVVAIDVKKTYTESCAMCHSAFLSPGSGDWAGYTPKGIDKVYANGINGTESGMPAKGGADLSDADFKTMVDYLISGKVK